MTTDIKIRLVLDRAGYSQAINQAGAEAAGMGRSISGGAQQASGSLDGMRNSVRGVAIALGDIAKGAVVFNAAAAGARQLADAIGAIPTRGISFIAETEVAQLGMAGILQSMVEIEGRAPSFAQAQDLAAGAVSRLQKAAADTAASSDDLIATYRALLGPALAAGMSMQQVERFTVVGANAIKSMGMSTGQMVQELRDLAQGGITAAGSTLATALGIKDADIAKAKSSSEGLFAFLMARMQGFASTSDAYAQTLKGGWEALGEQITQASAQAMAPAAAEIKVAIADISAALKGEGAVRSLASVGEGLASVVRGMSDGVQMAQQYSGAIGTLAAGYAALKVGQVAADISRATSAKFADANASRLAATQSALQAVANDAVTLSSRAQIAALLAEQRVKVQALATEAAITAAKLRTAEANAAQLVGMARLVAVEQQVLPLRQQHAQQTTALEQAQGRLAGAANASSVATRGLSVAMGAMGGPIGIFITSVAVLVGYLMSANSEANKLKLIGVSADRANAAMSKGGKVDPTDAGRLQSALAEAKEARDALLIKTSGKHSMYDRSKGLLGGDSNVETWNKELAAAEANVKRYEGLLGKIDAAQSAKPEPVVGLNATAGAKQINEMLDGIKSAATLKKEANTKLLALDKAYQDQRTAMIRRGDAPTAMADLEERVKLAKTQVASELKDALTRQAKTGTEGVSQVEKAASDLRLMQLKVASDARVAVMDTELARLEAQNSAGLLGVEEFETRKTSIAQSKLRERLVLIDQEIAAEEKRRPKEKAEITASQTRLAGLRGDRSGVDADLMQAGIAAQGAADGRRLEASRATADQTVQLWSTAQQRIEQLREQTRSTTVGLITDPVAKMRAEADAQIAELYKVTREQSKGLQVQIDVITDPGQRELLQQQIVSLAAETGRAVESVNTGLVERMKPGWQLMVEGWRDTHRMMRDASDQTMQNLVKGGEDAFVGLMQTGKLNVKGLVDSMIADFARLQFRQFVAGQSGSGGMLASLASGVMSMMGVAGGTGNAGSGNYSAAGLKAAFGYADGGAFGAVRKFASGGAFTNQVVSKPTDFLFRDGGRQRLGQMGEAGPEAVMPMPDGRGVQAISPDGQTLRTLPLGRDGSGRLSVVIERGSRFASGGAFGAVSAAGPASAPAAFNYSAPVSLTISNDAQMLAHINRMFAAMQRDLITRLKQAGVNI